MKHVLCAACVLFPPFGILYFFATKHKDEDQAESCLKISLSTLAVCFLAGFYFGGIDALQNTIGGTIIFIGCVSLIRCIIKNWGEVQ